MRRRARPQCGCAALGIPRWQINSLDERRVLQPSLADSPSIRSRSPMLMAVRQRGKKGLGLGGQVSQYVLGKRNNRFGFTPRRPDSRRTRAVTWHDQRLLPSEFIDDHGWRIPYPSSARGGPRRIDAMMESRAPPGCVARAGRALSRTRRESHGRARQGAGLTAICWIDAC